MRYFQSACRYLNNEIKQCLFALPDDIICNAVEIVLKANAPLYVVCKQDIFFIGKAGYFSNRASRFCYTVSEPAIKDAVLRSCGYSLSAHQKEIENGFIGLDNGCRMSIGSASGVFNHALYSPELFRSLRIRIAREIRTDTRALFFDGNVVSSMIVGQPASGKTTFLRSLAHDLSSGMYSHCYRICVIDERNEIFPIGFERPACVEVLSGINKREAIDRSVRLCMPEIIICDEIGTLQEANAIVQSLNSGVLFICSMHAHSYAELRMKPSFRVLAEQGVFERILCLKGARNPGKIFEIYNKSEKDYENIAFEYSEFCSDRFCNLPIGQKNGNTENA